MSAMAKLVGIQGKERGYHASGIRDHWIGNTTCRRTLFFFNYFNEIITVPLYGRSSH